MKPFTSHAEKYIVHKWTPGRIFTTGTHFCNHHSSPETEHSQPLHATGQWRFTIWEEEHGRIGELMLNR